MGNEIDGMRIASSLAPETDEPDGDSGPADGEESGDGFICARFRSLELLAFFYLSLSLSLPRLADRAKTFVNE